jgi:putative peptide zinc metalloprotease protein
MPVIVFVLVTLVAIDVWLFFHGILQGMQEIIYQPALILVFFLLETVAMAWHECGHASACRYGGAKPGVVGAGIYVFWFVFYSDVTDSYRLGKIGRLRTDFGGMYFDTIFSLVVAGAYFLTGFEPLLVLVLFNQLNALEEFSPFLRFDGYYIVSDLTGVPDLFKYIKPVLRSLIPGREADESLKALKPWVRVVLSVWVLSVIPMLLIGLVMLIIYGPWALATAWDSFLVNYGAVSSAVQDGRIIDGILGLINIGTLVVPVVGGILIFAVVVKRWSVAAWRWSEGRTLLRTGLVLGLAAATSLLLFVYSHANSPGPGLSQVVTLALDLPQAERQQPEPLQSGVDHEGGYLDNSVNLPTAEDEANDGTYTVQPGDNLTQIATRLGVSVDQVAKSNGITNPDFIYSGQTLRFQEDQDKDRVGVPNDPTTNE